MEKIYLVVWLKKEELTIANSIIKDIQKKNKNIFMEKTTDKDYTKYDDIEDCVSYNIVCNDKTYLPFFITFLGILGYSDEEVYESLRDDVFII